MLARLESLNFFCSIPGKEFIDFRESRLATTWQHAYCERDNCHLSLQLAISRSLVHFAAAVACIPDTWTPRNSGVSKWYGTAYQTRFGRATTGYVDRPQAAMSTSSGTDWRAGRRSPPPPSRLHWRSNSDHAGKRYVLRRNRESRSRPGNCDSRPGNAISRELTSVDFTHINFK